MRQLLLCAILLGAGCRRQGLRVERMPSPQYPARAQVENVQGAVRVDVAIGADGKVIWAKGSGAHPLLVEAAEENVRQWVFGPFPPVSEFPIYHTVTFAYKLEGPPLSIGIRPVIRTHLPDRVEVQARLFKDDTGFQRVSPPKPGEGQK